MLSRIVWRRRSPGRCTGTRRAASTRSFISPGLLLLAIAGGGLGALVQAARSLVEHPGTRTPTAPWIAWYLGQSALGIVTGAIAFATFTRVFLVRGAPLSALSSLGVLLLGLCAGLASSRVIAKVRAVTAR